MACSSDDVTCGPGTVLSGSQCVVADGGTPDLGGSSNGGALAATGGASSGGTVSSGGGSAGGGGGAGNGGTATGGATEADGSADGGASSGGSASGDSGTGGSGSVVPPKESHWAAIASDAAYAYDLTKAGGAAAAVKVGTYLPVGAYIGSLPPVTLPDPSPWSPDGRWLLAGDSTGLVVRDMSGDTPGAPINLGALSPTVYWSGDSKSLAVFENQSLSVVNPLQATPIRKPIADSVTYLQWAPKGNLLYFASGGEHFVVRVVAGVPQTPQKFPGTAPTAIETGVQWIPDGEHLIVKNGVATVMDFRGATYKAHPIPDSAPYSAIPNYDGSLVAFKAESTSRASYVAIGESGLGAPSTVGGDSIGPRQWASEANMLVTYGDSSTTFANVFGPNGPGPRLPIPALHSVAAISPGGNLVVLYRSDVSGLASWDTTAPTRPPVELPTDGFEPPTQDISFSSDGKTIFYSIGEALRVQNAATGVYSDAAPGYKPRWPVWSPGGSFIGIRSYNSGSSSVQVRTYLLRIEGTNASAPIPTSSKYENVGRIVFQPTSG